MLTIKANQRDKSLNLDNLRAEGNVPAVLYGPKQENTCIFIAENELLKVYKEAGESSVISLKEGSNDHDVLIHEIKFDAVTCRPIHVDFYAIEKGKKIEVSVPLEFVGKSDAIEILGGSLVKVMHELDIVALPKDLPQNLEVDISVLVDFDSQIKAGDIKLPAGVELDMEADEVIALVKAAREEEPEEAAFNPDAVKVENEKPAEPTEEKTA